jgi:hypothetical protein
MKCTECGQRPAVSIALGRCDVCLYREQFGSERTAAQLRAAAEAKRRQDDAKVKHA